MYFIFAFIFSVLFSLIFLTKEYTTVKNDTLSAFLLVCANCVAGLIWPISLAILVVYGIFIYTTKKFYPLIERIRERFDITD